METSKKISDFEIEITKQVEPEKIVYERSFIESEIASKTREIALRNAEIVELEIILFEMDRLGIINKDEVLIEEVVAENLPEEIIK